MDGTNQKIDTPLARGRSRPVRLQLIGPDGKKYGKYETGQLAIEEAQRLWPDLPQDENRTGAGWDVQVAGIKT